MGASGISQADIARMAGVGRAAVSNWRVRYADFPQPTGGTRHAPTFDADAVELWLAEHLAQPASPDRASPDADASPLPLAEPLLALLRRAHARRPGVWLLHEDVVDNGLATAPLIRRLAGEGHVERLRVNFSRGPRVLLRIPHADQAVDACLVEQQANAVLAAVGHHVKIMAARDTASNYTVVKIKHRGRSYTGYLRTRHWSVIIAENGDV